MSLENIDIVSRPCGSSARCSFSDEENEDHLGSRSMDMTTQNLDFSFPGSGKILGNSNDVEAEMRRLRLELKQTMDMYSTACKEAISAKQKVVPIHLDVFRGDVSLFKQLLSSYKLPFFKKEPKQKRATDSKFQRLSYHAMCYCILHDEDVPSAIFSIWEGCDLPIRGKKAL